MVATGPVVLRDLKVTRMVSGATNIDIGSSETQNTEARVRRIIRVKKSTGNLWLRVYTSEHIIFCYRLNRLWALPRGFGAFAALEILDLTYNNLNERVLPGNFFMMGTPQFIRYAFILTMFRIFVTAETLRALFLGDNDFEAIPAEIGQLHNLQVVSKIKKWR